MLGAGALGRPRGMVWGGRREEGSGWGTHVLKLLNLRIKKKRKKNIYIYNLLNKTISKSGQKQAKKKKKKQGVLESPICYYILSTADISGFLTPLTRGICI